MRVQDTPFTPEEIRHITHKATDGQCNKLTSITEDESGRYKFTFLVNYSEQGRLNIRENSIYIRFAEIPLLSDYFGGKVRTLFAGSTSNPIFIGTI